MCLYVRPFSAHSPGISVLVHALTLVSTAVRRGRTPCTFLACAHPLSLP